MKKFIFLLLTSVVAVSLNAQVDVIATTDCEPQTYSYSPQLYTPDVGECNVEFVGPLYQTVPTEGTVYTTLQVLAGMTYHQALPLGFGSRTTHITKYYMNPYLYEQLGPTEALRRAVDAGFPCPKIVTIQAATEFPGFQFN